MHAVHLMRQTGPQNVFCLEKSNISIDEILLIHSSIGLQNIKRQMKEQLPMAIQMYRVLCDLILNGEKASIDTNFQKNWRIVLYCS